MDTCQKPECERNKTQAVINCLNAINWFWHYGQVMTKEDKHELATSVKGLYDHGDPTKTANEIAALLARNEVEVIVKSKHREIPYNPTGAKP